MLVGTPPPLHSLPPNPPFRLLLSDSPPPFRYLSRRHRAKEELRHYPRLQQDDPNDRRRVYGRRPLTLPPKSRESFPANNNPTAGTSQRAASSVARAPVRRTGSPWFDPTAAHDIDHARSSTGSSAVLTTRRLLVRSQPGVLDKRVVSSAAEHSADNREAGGSNPPRRMEEVGSRQWAVVRSK